MPVGLIRFIFVALVAGAAVPAWGAGIPDYGTKNFSPGGDSPSYFTNENGVVVGVSESDGTDDGTDTPIRSLRSGYEERESSYRTTSNHRKLGASHDARYVATGHLRGKDRLTRAISTNSRRSAPAIRLVRSGRTANTMIATTRVRTADAGGAKFARKNPRHAFSAKSQSRKG